MYDVVQGVLELVFTLTAPLVLAYFLLINTSYLALVLISAVEFRGHMDRKDTRRDQIAGELAPGVSVIVPAYNEEALIVSSVQALLTLRYPQHEVVVVDDGSTDGTLAALVDAFDLVVVPSHHPGEIPVRASVHEVLVPRNGRTRLIVVTKANSGRSEAINVGVNTAREPLVALIDADSILEPDALVRVTQSFIDDPSRVVAAGGTVRAINGSTVSNGRIVRLRMPRSWLARAQVVEYLRSFLIGRTGWASMGTLLLISGAFGVYRRDVVIEAGGLDPDSIGEDFELCLRVHKMMRDRGRDYRVVFVPEPVCWTEVPSTRAVLRRQRSRWHRGLWETLWAYRGMLFRRRYGRIGWVGLPYYWLFELMAPLVEAGGLVLVPLGMAFGVVNVQYALTPAARVVRLRDLRDPGGDVRRGVGLPPLRPVARPGHRGRGRRLREPGLPPDDRGLAARGLVGEPARPATGLGRHDAPGVRGGGRMSAGDGSQVERPDDEVDRLRSEVERLRAQAEDRDQRLARVGHELRAPLASIAGYVEVLLDGALGDLAPEQVRALEVVGRNAERLRALVAELGSARPSREPARTPGPVLLDVAGVVRVAVDLLRPTARLGGVLLDERPPSRRAARAR